MPPKKKPQQAELLPLPLPWDDQVFRDAWDSWESHRKETKKPLTPTARRLQLKLLTQWGREAALASIERSINFGWQGLFEPRMNAAEAPAQQQPGMPGPPCPDWAARAARLRGREFKLSWWTHIKTDHKLLADLIIDMEVNP